MKTVVRILACFALISGVFACQSGAGGQSTTDDPAPEATEQENDQASGQEDAEADDTQTGDAGGASYFTAEQADRGEDTFENVCAYCHSESEFSGSRFMSSWGGAPVGQFFQLLRATMPYDAPGSLTQQQYTDVVAYILSLNDFPEGDTELPADPAALDDITMEVPSEDAG